MKKKYLTEREGQINFFENFRIDWGTRQVLVDNTDGVWKGNLFEFKKDIHDINEVLSQALKYLSKMRIKGESVPANILLIDLNKTIAYLYHSKDYFDDIHKVYIGAASKNNSGYIGKPYNKKIDYDTQEGAYELSKILKETDYMPIRLDENCIVGWGERYYRENPTANKGDFLGDNSGQVKIIGEIREPKIFKRLIQPYTESTNEKFKYLMDKLNDRLRKRDLGAFYTPMLYAEKACELVKEAIDRVPEGNDYIILDRCAGTGNLEEAILNTLGEVVTSHIICSTYEYYEYKVLLERLGDKVRTIIPPTEATANYSKGCILNADAMSEEYINNPIIKSYIDDSKCTVILFENPPYAETTSIEHQKKGVGKYSSNWKKNYVVSEMKKEVKGSPSNDMANSFIWSGFKFYLRQRTDSYVVFSPIKYWKSQNLINKNFSKGFAFNKKHFHTNSATCISCILWLNQNSNNNSISLDAYDIKDNNLSFIRNIKIKKVKNLYSTLYDKRNYESDTAGIASEANGKEAFRKLRIVPKYNSNILGYLVTQSFDFSQPRLKCNLVRNGLYNGNGFYLRRDNYLKKLPLFAGAKYPIEDDWIENGNIYTTADKMDAYEKDADLIKYSLIFTCLSQYNKCHSFHGSDGRYYQNELCFDEGTLALADIQKIELNDDEEELISLWSKILNEAKQCSNYHSQWRYGVYQITKELNTFVKIKNHGKEESVYNYPELNGDLNTLRIKLKGYYKKYITPKMFEYELLK